jgi:hypothetical protein
MITGANTNVRHRGVVFHVQTEDSGRANPHIISHLYHGGTILSSEKTSYADQIATTADLETLVRGLIEAQHKEMVRRLKTGEFDGAIAERLGADSLADTGGLAETPTPMPEAGPMRQPSPPPAAEATSGPGGERAFGEGIVSQKPLDEVILEYLAEKARDRAGDRTGGTVRKSRSRG